MRARALLLVVAALVAGVVVAPTAARPTEGPATVLAAASLTETLPRIDGAARASFGGSNQLAQQARQGFPFDVFLSASPRYTRALFAEAGSEGEVIVAPHFFHCFPGQGLPIVVRHPFDRAQFP
jgi:ABC-type molybdate transport system substrate-binding protein